MSSSISDSGIVVAAGRTERAKGQASVAADRQRVRERHFERNQRAAVVAMRRYIGRYLADFAPPRGPTQDIASRVMGMSADSLEMLFPTEGRLAELRIVRIESTAVAGTWR